MVLVCGYVEWICGVDMGACGYGKVWICGVFILGCDK